MKSSLNRQPLALAKRSGGRIPLSARDARHLANSLLLFAEETESNPAFNAATPYIQGRKMPRAVSRLEGIRPTVGGNTSRLPRVK